MNERLSDEQLADIASENVVLANEAVTMAKELIERRAADLTAAEVFAFECLAERVEEEIEMGCDTTGWRRTALAVLDKLTRVKP